MKKYSFTLDEKLKQDFKEMCKKQGYTMSSRIQVLIRRDIESHRGV